MISVYSMSIIHHSTHLTMKLLLTGILFCTCTATPTSEQQIAEDLQNIHFKEGDIVFREGTGWESRIIRMMDPHGEYTHTGIITNSKGTWLVIHAVPNEPDYKGDIDRVKIEPVTSFFNKSRAIHGEVKRIDDSLKAKKAASIAFQLYQRHTLFDHDYDDTDSTRMYCTELVDFAFCKAGINLTDKQDRRSGFSGFTGNYLFPTELCKSPQLTSIFKY